MPYYQYPIHEEHKLRQNQQEINKKEQEEADRFNYVLKKEENSIINLLDLFFPPVFRKILGRPVLYPTLPGDGRKKTLEFLKQEMMSGSIPSVHQKDFLVRAFESVLQEGYVTASAATGLISLQSCAVVPYLSNDQPTPGEYDFLGHNIDTILFVEMLIEKNLLSLELLHFDVVRHIFEHWNVRRLTKLKDQLLREEGWPLIDAVSVLSEFYTLPIWVSDTRFVTGFGSWPSIVNKPLRWEPNPLESPHFKRPRGRVDSDSLPDQLLVRRQAWNENFQQLQKAMSLGKIVHSGRSQLNHIDVIIDEDSLKKWCKKKQFPHYVCENDIFYQPQDPIAKDIDEPLVQLKIDGDKQLLSRPAIKRNYDLYSRDQWDKALSRDQFLLNKKITGQTAQKDRYRQSDIENWLIEQGIYTYAELASLKAPSR